MADERRDDRTTDLAVLRSARDESRAVLDDQLAELSDIGDKALWTARTSTIMLGVVVSAASLGDEATLRRLDVTVRLLGAVGVVLLVVSSVYGLGTYFGAQRVRGISASYRQQAQRGSVSERWWWQSLLRGYDRWIADMEEMTDTCGTHLFRAQMVFVLGILAFVLTAGLSIWPL